MLSSVCRPKRGWAFRSNIWIAPTECWRRIPGKPQINLTQVLEKCAPKQIGGIYKRGMGFLALVEWKMERILTGRWNFRFDAQMIWKFRRFGNSVSRRGLSLARAKS
jgi:hypothetical protein